MTDQPKPEEKPNVPLVVNQKQIPCGCVYTEFSNKTVDLRACLPCALRNAGSMLLQAADRVAEIAARRIQV